MKKWEKVASGEKGNESHIFFWSHILRFCSKGREKVQGHRQKKKIEMREESSTAPDKTRSCTEQTVVKKKKGERGVRGGNSL